MQAEPPPSASLDLAAMIPDVKVPAGLTLGALVGGLALGLVLAGRAEAGGVVALTGPVGALWLRALQMTIIPLVASLLVIGVVQTVAAAQAGAMARRTLGLFAAILTGGAVLAAVLMPLLIDLMPVPERAAIALRGAGSAAAPVPDLAGFVAALVPANVLDAAAQDAVLPTIVFFALFAVAITRLQPAPQRVLFDLFAALAGAMMVIIGWVLRLAPIGVFALAVGVAAQSGEDVIAALGHYIALVAAIGGIVLVAGYALAAGSARLGLARFARAMLPVQAVALSTQSSLASLPAMLGACRALGVRPASAELVLPLAVALFRATGPAMNLAVVIYVARLTGTVLTPQVLATGAAVALLTTLGSVSLPGTISFVTAIAPIALAMGVPVGPLGLLVAVEMLPDLMRTVGNVTMDVAVTATVDRRNAAN